METTVTKIRENREKCIKMQQKMKKSPLSIYEEKVEEYIEKYIDVYDDLNSIIEGISEENDEIDNVKIDMNSVDYLLNIELTIEDIKKELYDNFDKNSREENVDLVTQLNFFKALYADFDNVSKNDEFVEQENKCVLVGK